MSLLVKILLIILILVGGIALLYGAVKLVGKYFDGDPDPDLGEAILVTVPISLMATGIFWLIEHIYLIPTI